MTLRRGMDLGEKSHECSCADTFVSGYVFVLTKALKTLLDLFFCLVWLRSSSPSCASRTTRGGHLFSSWSRWWKSLRPSFPPTSSPLSLWTSPLSGSCFSGLFSCFVQLSSSLIHVSDLHPDLYTGEARRVAKLLQITERCVLIPAEWASDDFPFIRLASLLLFLLFLFSQDGTASEYAVNMQLCTFYRSLRIRLITLIM